MFAPRRSPADRPEGQDPRFKDIVLCEASSSPLMVPSVLVASIWDQVNQGLRAVPRGGSEVGGLFLARRSDALVIAETVVPIPIEYHFGPSFRLSPSDLKGIEKLMASLQKDPSKVVVGLYRSRTRTDSLSEESESAVLHVLEQAHTSFASDFHYFVAFTPLSKTVMTVSASFRKEEGWDEWQHVWLVTNPRSSPGPLELAAPPTPPKSPLEPGSPPEQPSATTAKAPQAESLSTPPSERLPQAGPIPPPPSESEPLNLPDSSDRVLPPAAEPDYPVDLAWTGGYPADTGLQHGSPRVVAWFVVGAILLAAIILGISVRRSPATRPVNETEARSGLPPVSPPATSPASPRLTGFLAVREGPLWRLTWERAAMESLNPMGAVLLIRDGAQQKEVRLTPSDLSRGAILYEPQSSDLFFSLNIVMPSGQLTEEHVRVLQGRSSGEAPVPTPKPAPTPKMVVQVETPPLRSFSLPPNRPKDPSTGGRAVTDVPPPPALLASPTQPLSSVLSIAPAAPVQPASAGVSKPPGSPETSAAAAQLDLAQQLVGSWEAMRSESPFSTESASVSVMVLGAEVNGWFVGKYKVPKNGPPFKQSVNFAFRGDVGKDRLPEGAWLFAFRSNDGWQGTIKLRPQGSTLDATWKTSVENGKTYTFEHVMSRASGK
jgi:hypothetical protein